MSVFPNNIDTLLNDAATSAKTLVGSQEIEDLLKISPHTRAGERGADMALNVAASELWKGKSHETRVAIQEVVRLHSQKETLGDAAKLLKTIQKNNNFKDGISQIGYKSLLRLIYAAITDESWGDAKDIPGRWRSLMNRMSRAQNEYRPGDKACLAGIFNALLEPLSSVHPDVLIIPSFRLMMGEIALEEDDGEFERRVHVALSYLGPDANKDEDYKEVMMDVTNARLERQNKDTADLQKLGVALRDLQNLSNEDFETKAAELISGLPQSTKKEGENLIEMVRKGCYSRSFSESLEVLPIGELHAQGLSLLATYPEKYQRHLETFVLRRTLQEKRARTEKEMPQNPQTKRSKQEDQNRSRGLGYQEELKELER